MMPMQTHTCTRRGGNESAEFLPTHESEEDACHARAERRLRSLRPDSALLDFCQIPQTVRSHHRQLR
jgi:hypothetical protein